MRLWDNRTRVAPNGGATSDVVQGEATSGQVPQRTLQRPLEDLVDDPLNKLHVSQTPVHIALAYNYVLDAMDGRLANGRGNLYFANQAKQLCFLLHSHEMWTHMIYLVAFVHAFLAFWEPPTWGHASAVCYALEFLCLAVYSIDIYLKMVYMGARVYVSKKWHRSVCYPPPQTTVENGTVTCFYESVYTSPPSTAPLSLSYWLIACPM
ncbi:uncharacterized protein MONBRDRAFT_29508 [Monosiga brevicollis MX1]|uniref:Uncharacterized protein n=1 Tax=Monosiga brevicollis TaxID=81824 RepID=A9VBA5_MONBE|nr:uncharacterized protein MONBRDRAFT_29508 [Monosiga brevicollis MX1]EDQ85153.1 predicted protein [Monosiga brevicollis MX1]|eukprot:XP_001749978.1 hypothetical protein [Monosiga brevicollis MX1]